MKSVKRWSNPALGRLTVAVLVLLIAASVILVSGCYSTVGNLLEKLSTERPIVMLYVGDALVTPDTTVFFTDTVVGDKQTIMLRVLNIGTSVLQVSGVALDDGPVPCFLLDADAPASFDIPASSEYLYSLGFQPPEAMQYTGILEFATNDPDIPTVTFAVTGTGSGVPPAELIAPTLSGFADMTKTTGDGTFIIMPPTSNSIGAFSYSSGSDAVATISGNQATVKGAGSCTITATQAVSGSYRSGSITATLTVNLMPPGLANFSDIIKNWGNGPFTLTAPSSLSIGQITYASNNQAVATVSGNTVTITGAGTCTITATQAATAMYATGSIGATLTVSPIAPTIGALAPMTKDYGAAAFTPSAPTSNSSGSFSYSSSNTAVATSNGTVLTIVGAGTSTITATQAAAGNYTSGSTSAILTVNAVIPTLTTNSVTGIHATYATGGGNVTSTGGATVTVRGVCWGTATNPTTSGSKLDIGSGTGLFSGSFSGLTVGTTYYVRAYASNSAGTGYGNQVSFQAVYGIGDTYAGGLIFSISGTYPNQHGLVTTANNLTSAPWTYNGFATNALSLTDGAGNTANIVASQPLDQTNYAAKICDACTEGGYTDWYLPAHDQMETLYAQRAYIPTFTAGNYWSSTQWPSQISYGYEFNYDGWSGRWYSTTNRVRAIRSF